MRISHKLALVASKSPGQLFRDLVKFARKNRYERAFIVRRYFGIWDWRFPRRGTDKTAYLIGLFGSGRGYITQLMLKNAGKRAKYFRETIRFHPGPTSMIYSGHATIKYACREQALPEVTAHILEGVRSGFAVLVFINRHPLDSLLTNWIFWRIYLRDNIQIEGITKVYKNMDELSVDLERNFSEFKAFAEGNPEFFAKVPGPRFLSFAEFVEEAELYCQVANLTLRLEDFMINPDKEFRKILELMAINPHSNQLDIAAPKTKAYGYLAVKEKSPQFQSFINGLSAETKKRIEKMGYSI